MDDLVGPRSRIFFSQRLRLHYVDWGNREAPPLLLVHGGRDHCRNWDFLATRLRKDWHIIAPDLRGHGDSEWPSDGNYTMANYVYDLAQLIHQQKLAPVTIIAHSLGGMIALRFAGIYPEMVKRLVSIEGMGPPPKVREERARQRIDERMRTWVEKQRAISGRMPRRYPTLEAAFQRMHDENKHLTSAQARHLTQHGVNQNEDGTYSWKFDNYVRIWPPVDMSFDETKELWGRITCPTLLMCGGESWASNPAEDGTAAYFKRAEVVSIPEAGHWLHHDKLEEFIDIVQQFFSRTC